jgi:hypothetical protein
MREEAMSGDFFPKQLDAANAAERLRLIARDEFRRAATPPPDARAAGWNNLHAHSIYSFNPYGYSPAGLAWRARHAGLDMLGMVDFDVLDGMEELFAAGRAFGIKTVAGFETRIFVPEFADRVINSPGEPGVAYHLGLGFPATPLPPTLTPFLMRLRAASERRTRDIARRIAPALLPVQLEYESDVLPLTPAGNVTERHLCLACARKAAATLNLADLAAYWRERLGLDADPTDLPDGVDLQGRIRAKLMKQGGIGYVAPDGGSFPALSETNRFIRDCGAVPTLAWLDGSSAGEQSPDALLDFAIASGTAAVNLIPDRNFTPGVRNAKLDRMNAFLAAARRRDLPIVAGTEMNSPGNKFVDDFDAAELAPFLPDFRRGARIFFAHTVLQSRASAGLLSDWALSAFRSAADRNDFFEEMGRILPPGSIGIRPAHQPPATPADWLDEARRLAADAGSPA